MYKHIMNYIISDFMQFSQILYIYHQLSKFVFFNFFNGLPNTAKYYESLQIEIDFSIWFSAGIAVSNYNL